jgi:hypothetical protein
LAWPSSKLFLQPVKLVANLIHNRIVGVNDVPGRQIQKSTLMACCQTSGLRVTRLYAWSTLFADSGRTVMKGCIRDDTVNLLVRNAKAFRAWLK